MGQFGNLIVALLIVNVFLGVFGLGGVEIFLANAIGLLNFIPAMFPVSLEVLGNMLKTLLSIYFGWTAIEWLRGKD